MTNQCRELDMQEYVLYHLVIEQNIHLWKIRVGEIMRKMDH